MKNLSFKQAVKKAWKIMTKRYVLIPLGLLQVFFWMKNGVPGVQILLCILIIYLACKDKPRFKEPEPEKNWIDDTK